MRKRGASITGSPGTKALASPSQVQMRDQVRKGPAPTEPMPVAVISMAAGELGLSASITSSGKGISSLAPWNRSTMSAPSHW
jgi:hypothetical protein